MLRGTRVSGGKLCKAVQTSAMCLCTGDAQCTTSAPKRSKQSESQLQTLSKVLLTGHSSQLESLQTSKEQEYVRLRAGYVDGSKTQFANANVKESNHAWFTKQCIASGRDEVQSSPSVSMQDLASRIRYFPSLARSHTSSHIATL